MKKVFLFLVCVSLVGFAKSPTRRHRVQVPEPDQVKAQPRTQQQVAEMVALALLDHIQIPSFAYPVNGAIARDLLATARKYIGARYSRGSSGPYAFDCSGFTSFVFKRLGIDLLRSSQEQSMQGTVINHVRELLPGDLVFFGHTRNNKTVNHVGIVTDVDYVKGTFRFIHSSTSYGVRIDSSEDDYWSTRFMWARRIIGNDE